MKWMVLVLFLVLQKCTVSFYSDEVKRYSKKTYDKPLTYSSYHYFKKPHKLNESDFKYDSNSKYIIFPQNDYIKNEYNRWACIVSALSLGIFPCWEIVKYENNLSFDNEEFPDKNEIVENETTYTKITSWVLFPIWFYREYFNHDYTLFDHQSNQTYEKFFKYNQKIEPLIAQKKKEIQERMEKSKNFSLARVEELNRFIQNKNYIFVNLQKSCKQDNCILYDDFREAYFNQFENPDILNKFELPNNTSYNLKKDIYKKNREYKYLVFSNLDTNELNVSEVEPKTNKVELFFQYGNSFGNVPYVYSGLFVPSFESDRFILDVTQKSRNEFLHAYPRFNLVLKILDENTESKNLYSCKIDGGVLGTITTYGDEEQYKKYLSKNYEFFCNHTPSNHITKTV